MATVAAGLSVRYIISEEFSVGGAVAGTYSNTADSQVATGENPQPNTNSLSTSASLFADYLVTPKTNARLILSAGEDLQDFSQGITEGRRYFEAMILLTYQFAPKLSVDAGGGVGYVIDQKIADPAYTGVRPVYTLGLNYTPTEKTYFKAKFGMQGADYPFRLQSGCGLGCA
jgi:long-subunit fatty acid transport protein